MLEKPALKDERIVGALLDAYGLRTAHVLFLPLGADANTAVYRVETGQPAAYFLKLRKGIFEETTVLLPLFFHERGIRQVIEPLKTLDGRLWTGLDEYICVLYPFVEGQDGWDQPLTDRQWVDFGAALKGIHSLDLPPELRVRIPAEIYSPHWRAMVRDFQAQAATANFADPVAARMAVFMNEHRHEVSFLVERAGQLADKLRSRPPEVVLCHSDIHAGNLMLTPDEDLYIVDWDNPILAPKERDLMFIGGGVGDLWNSEREEALFYQGYGASHIHLAALAYYRWERIVEDIAEFCEQILATQEGGEDREQGLRYFTSQFMPGSVIEIAHRTDERLRIISAST